MPVRRRTDKRRDALDEDSILWLQGSDRSWFQFASLEERLACWEAHGDAAIATWDRQENTNPTMVLGHGGRLVSDH